MDNMDEEGLVTKVQGIGLLFSLELEAMEEVEGGHIVVVEGPLMAAPHGIK